MRDDFNENQSDLNNTANNANQSNLINNSFIYNDNFGPKVII